MSDLSLRSLAALVVLVASPLFAQEFRAGITGIVHDSQGAAIPKVAVEAANLETSEISRAVTNDSGYYAIPALGIGFYRVTVTAPGFKKAERARMELRSGDQVQLDFTLEVGAVQETIEVTAEAGLLQTTATDKGQVVDSVNVEDTPSVGRNPFLLGVVASGVQFDIGAGPLSRAVRPFDAGNNVAESMSINGGRLGASDLLLDGLSNTGTETTTPTNMGFVPSPDAVQQFRIQTSNYDAQYGRTAGGTVSVSIKSGTNAYHGTIYEYVRNTIISANTFDQNRIGKPRSDFHWNQPGAEIDGPLVIPHLYNGHNKTFFMYSYEKIMDEIPSPVTSTVPLADQRNGIFNTTLQSNGQPVLVYDPLTTVQTSSTSYTRQPFAGNVIPASRMNPIAVKILSYVPLPNYPGATNNYIAAPNARTDDYDAHVFRLDHIVNDRYRFFTRFVRGNRSEVNSDNGYKGPASPQYADGRLNQAGNLDLTTILNPSTVLTSRIGYFRHQLWINLYSDNFDPTLLGFPQSLSNLAPHFLAAENRSVAQLHVTRIPRNSPHAVRASTNGIFVRQEGFPLAAPAGYYSSGINPALPDSQATDTRAFNTCTLLTSGVRENCPTTTEPVAFIQQQPNTLRTLSIRFPAIRPPKVPSLDISLFKAFTLREGIRLQFRAEAFNALNAPQLGAPSTSLGSTAAGSVGLTQTNDPRNLQMAVKILF